MGDFAGFNSPKESTLKQKLTPSIKERSASVPEAVAAIKSMRGRGISGGVWSRSLTYVRVVRFGECASRVASCAGGACMVVVHRLRQQNPKKCALNSKDRLDG